MSLVSISSMRLVIPFSASPSLSLISWLALVMLFSILLILDSSVLIFAFREGEEGRGREGGEGRVELRDYKIISSVD